MKTIRDIRGMTQQEVADLVGTTQATIAKLERGDMTMTYDWARKLSSALDCSVEQLVYDDIEASDPAHDAYSHRTYVHGSIEQSWVDELEEIQDPSELYIPYMPDRLFPRGEYVAYGVADDSASAIVRRGGYVLVVSWETLGLSIAEGMDVVVRETQREGSFFRYAIKRVSGKPGDWELTSLASAKRARPVGLGEDDETGISREILGLIVEVRTPHHGTWNRRSLRIQPKRPG